MIGIGINPRWSKGQFFSMLVGVNLTFFPQHFLGLMGMPRRYVDYRDCYSSWHALSRFGSLVSLISVFTFILILTEAICSQRAVCSPFYFCNRREWLWRLYPIPYHGLKENVFMVLFKSKKGKEEEGFIKRAKRGFSWLVTKLSYYYASFRSR